MGAISAGSAPTDIMFKSFTTELRKMHRLREPTSFNAGLAWDNLAYQMQYSAETLEAQLAGEGCHHVLQINLCWEGGAAQPQLVVSVRRWCGHCVG